MIVARQILRLALLLVKVEGTLVVRKVVAVNDGLEVLEEPKIVPARNCVEHGEC